MSTERNWDRLVGKTLDLLLERDDARAEVERLRRRIDVLNAKLVELSDPQRVERQEAAAIRAAYRRGYLAGRSAARRGAPATAEPERRARGWVRDVIGGAA